MVARLNDVVGQVYTTIADFIGQSQQNKKLDWTIKYAEVVLKVGKISYKIRGIIGVLLGGFFYFC